MSNNTILILIAVAAGCLTITVIAYYIARSLKGSIKIYLPRTAFNPGDAITGEFVLNVKRHIQGNKLTVGLIGVKTTETYRNGKTETHSQEIYRDERVIEEAKAYDTGHIAKHEFEMKAPNLNAPEFMKSTLGQVLSAAATLLSNNNVRLKWRVEARLDAKGIDLAAAKSVMINTMG
jgi:hypothetical protein